VPHGVLKAFEDQGYLALEITVNTSSISRAKNFLSLLERDHPKLYYRFHTPLLPEYDPFSQKVGSDFKEIKYLIDFISDSFGGGYLILHSQTEPTANAIEAASLLSNYASRKGVKINLENLAGGWTSNLGELAAIAEMTGFKLVLDIGHLNSSDCVRFSQIKKEEALKLVAPYLVGAHIYEYEASGHHAPCDYLIIGELLRVLFEAEVGWWVIEIENEVEFLQTYKLLKDFFSFKH
jgi:sugar phosphate isomerase/epimerase